jgi:hypothetical protein
MKKIIVTLATAIAFTGVIAQTGSKETTQTPQTAPAAGSVASAVKFKSETIAFGKIKQNNPVTAEWTFTNTSKAPLVIEYATGTCGCTVAEKPEKPIMPGKTGTIRATYNATHVGAQDKTVTVKFYDIADVKVLHLTCDIEVPAAPAANKN